jgi:hypothetical protein
MGWIYGWNSRRELIDHLLRDEGSYKVLKHCCVGNNLWIVFEVTNDDTGELKRTAFLYLLDGQGKKDGRQWGYKSIDESMGPYEISFPASWLDLLTPTNSPYALNWREKVRQRAEKTAAMKPGTEWKFASGVTYTIVKRRSGKGLLVRTKGGQLYRASVDQFLVAEQVTEEKVPCPM